jgi:hypothetical protein
MQPTLHRWQIGRLHQVLSRQRAANAEPLARVATNANPGSTPMNRSVTPPANGAKECGFADQIEVAPQESRRRSRPGSSTAVASLARHGICAVAARSSHGSAHAAPDQPLLWVCRSRPSAAPSAVQARQPQPQTLPVA